MNPVSANLMAWLGWRNSLRIICAVGFLVNVLCITALPTISLIAYIDRRKLPEKEREEADEIVFAMVEDEYDFVKHAGPSYLPGDVTSTSTTLFSSILSYCKKQCNKRTCYLCDLLVFKLSIPC